MIDLKTIRNEPQPALDALARRKDGSDDRLREALELDARRREIIPRSEELSAKQNAANDAIADVNAANEAALDNGAAAMDNAATTEANTANAM